MFVAVAGFMRQFRELLLGSGQTDLYAGVGAMVAGASARASILAGYNARLPDEVSYNPGGAQCKISENSFANSICRRPPGKRSDQGRWPLRSAMSPGRR